MEAFEYNPNAKYETGGVYPQHLEAANLTDLMLTVGRNEIFSTKVSNIWQKYPLPNVNNKKIIDAWGATPMRFWQNQLNFAVWCATSGCGVSFKDHMMSKDSLIQSLYIFHVYYTTRRILNEMKVALPYEDSWDQLSNSYDRGAYEDICDRFGVSPYTDWRVSGPNHGLGDVYIYYTGDGYDKAGIAYDSSTMTFTHHTTNDILHIDYLQQDPSISDGWSTFVLEKSKGFTREGLVRLDDSIQTYVWALLGAQAQARSSIIGNDGAAFRAQEQFIRNVEDAINAPVDLQTATERYQKVLQYASTPVDFVFGRGLYMAPSDMLMKIGRIAGYNNKVVVASNDLQLGRVGGLNEINVPPNNGGTFSDGKIVATPTTDPLTTDPLAKKGNKLSTPTADSHEDEKVALVVGGVITGLVALWFLRR